MKKLFFSFVMLVTLVIVAGSAKGQSSITPYLGATYSYSVANLDPAGTGGRDIEIFLTASNNSNMTISDDYVVSAGTTITGVAAGTNFYKGNIPEGSTSFSFKIEYKSAGALKTDGTTYRLWIKVYDGATGACSNTKFLDITPAANNFELAITAMNDDCQKVGTPTVQNVMGSNGQYTEFTYDITAAGVGTGQNWRFTLSLNKTTMNYLTTNTVEFVTATATGGTGEILPTVPYSGGSVTLTAPSTATTVQVKFRILTTPGAEETFVSTLSNEKLLNATSTLELYTDDAKEDNADVKLKRVPYIGNFSGDN